MVHGLHILCGMAWVCCTYCVAWREWTVAHIVWHGVGVLHVLCGMAWVDCCTYCSCSVVLL